MLKTSPFNVGDKVRCTSDYHSGGGLQVNKVYTVHHVRLNSIGKVVVRLVETGHVHWNVSRFTKVADAEPEEQEQGVGEFILILFKDGKLLPATKPRVYTSARQAKRVACEMAERHAGHTFRVFKAVAEADAPPSKASYRQV